MIKKFRRYVIRMMKTTDKKKHILVYADLRVVFDEFYIPCFLSCKKQTICIRYWERGDGVMMMLMMMSMTRCALFLLWGSFFLCHIPPHPHIVSTHTKMPKIKTPGA